MAMPSLSGNPIPSLHMPKEPTPTTRTTSGKNSGNKIGKNGNAARLLIHTHHRPASAQTPEKSAVVPSTPFRQQFRQDSGNKIGKISGNKLPLMRPCSQVAFYLIH